MSLRRISSSYNRDPHSFSSSPSKSLKIRRPSNSLHNEAHQRQSPKSRTSAVTNEANNSTSSHDFMKEDVKIVHQSSQLSLDKMVDDTHVIHVQNTTQPSIPEDTIIELDAYDSEATLPLLPSNTQCKPKPHSLFLHLQCIPAVILGLILNILDALSYGIIIFPVSSSFIPASATHAGISMFLLSTIISQSVFSVRGLGIRGAVGSMMIEVMPFLYSMNQIVANTMGSNATDKSILATVMICYALSTILTGVVFYVLGKYKLGNVIQFFPRHILVGCIGGIGLFLLATAVEVTTSVSLAWRFTVFTRLFEIRNMKLWLSALSIACVLKITQRKIKHPLFVPVFYSTLPMLFFAVSFAMGYSVADLRSLGWLLNLTGPTDTPFYEFYSYYDFSSVNILAVAACIPTMIALTLFGILHVPINVPALALSTDQDEDLNYELVSHGITNILSGLSGTLQNYIVYSNSVLYYRSGGTTMFAGVLLAAATTVVMIYGGFVVTLMPVVVVGAYVLRCV